MTNSRLTMVILLATISVQLAFSANASVKIHTQNFESGGFSLGPVIGSPPIQDYFGVLFWENTPILNSRAEVTSNGNTYFAITNQATPIGSPCCSSSRYIAGNTWAPQGGLNPAADGYLSIDVEFTAQLDRAFLPATDTDIDPDSRVAVGIRQQSKTYIALAEEHTFALLRSTKVS